MDSCQHLCLTPTRNESWIIGRFLAAAARWADHVIVADQGTTDGTVEEIQRCPSARLVINDSPEFDEAHRQRLLLTRARQIPGKRILFGLDADEALSSNCKDTDDWQRIMQAAPGTVLRFKWVNVLPGFTSAWIPPNRVSCGFVDDGSDHVGRTIHSPRYPNPVGAPVLDLDDIVVLHFQYVLWERMICKQRWYQAWEYLEHRQKGPLQIFREYHHMHGGWNKAEIYPLQPEWLAGYARDGIDFRSLQRERITWWDKDIVHILRKHGPRHFRRIALWDQDWNDIASKLALEGIDLSDPRSVVDKAAHRLLAMTQSNRGSWTVRALERALRLGGW